MYSTSTRNVRMGKKAEDRASVEKSTSKIKAKRRSRLSYKDGLKVLPKGQYEVEKVMGKKLESGKTLYLIKWEGYSSKHNTWEPADNISGELIADFEQQLEPPARDNQPGNTNEKATDSTPTRRTESSPVSAPGGNHTASTDNPVVESSRKTTADDIKTEAEQNTHNLVDALELPADTSAAPALEENSNEGSINANRGLKKEKKDNSEKLGRIVKRRGETIPDPSEPMEKREMKKRTNEARSDSNKNNGSSGTVATEVGEASTANFILKENVQRLLEMEDTAFVEKVLLKDIHFAGKYNGEIHFVVSLVGEEGKFLVKSVVLSRFCPQAVIQYYESQMSWISLKDTLNPIHLTL